MFTIEQIKQAHSKVKSGADFPRYVQDLIHLGVSLYETYVSDGHTIYRGKEDYTIQSGGKYGILKVADKSDRVLFQKELQEHQLGKTDFPTFCHTSAQSGVEKWVVDLVKMTCTYYDKAGNEILEEIIPTR